VQRYYSGIGHPGQDRQSRGPRDRDPQADVDANLSGEADCCTARDRDAQTPCCADSPTDIGPHSQADARTDTRADPEASACPSGSQNRWTR
jgi:hypothetical protein